MNSRVISLYSPGRTKAIIILLIMMAGNATFGQKIDRTYFLLGTLHDYMGRHYPKNNPCQWGYIMTLHENNIAEIRRIEEVTGVKFKRRKKQEDGSNSHEFFDLKSFFRARKINSFYDFSKNKGMKDMTGFTFYTGQLKCERLLKASENKQLSFLAGQFLTSGTISEEKYKLSLYNSSERFECLIKLLQNLNSVIITQEVVEGIPYAFFIEFIPTEEVKVILDKEQ